MLERLEIAARKRTLLCDGGFGTEIQKLGLEPGDSPERWNLTRPEDVKSIHRAYRAAGSDIVEANTFGGSRFKLAQHGLADKVCEINRAGAAIAREVAGDTQYVLGDIGPTGVFMEPYGDETEASLYEAFKTQALALAEGGADAAIVETMTAIEECCVAIRAVRENTKLTCVASFTFDPQPDGGYASMMGVTPEQFVEAAVKAGAQIVGSNCGLGPEHMIKVITRIRAATDLPVIAMPNAGMPVLQADGTTTFPTTPEELAADLPRLIAAGANIVGGCCGTNPKHIAALAAKLGIRKQ